MKKLNCDNYELLQLLIDNGFIIICDENMDKIIDDNDAAYIDEFVQNNAPAAINDYGIEDLDTYTNQKPLQQ